MPRGTDLEDELLRKIASYKHDPLGFVNFAFPWGEPGGPLAKFQGPQNWQVEVLTAIGASVQKAPQKGEFSVASGKGIGKSALVAWIALWAICTFPESRGVITAGTEPQLRTKTFPEVAKWFHMLICKHWFVLTATSMYARDIETEKTWKLDAIAWNESNPEAFAGLHNLGKRVLVIFDEASQIANPIWDTTDGIMSDADTEVIWPSFGNPTRGDGRFFENFNRRRHRVKTWNIDSRDVSITDKIKLNEQVADYGEDSDYVRMMVRGMFPRASSMQFIPTDMVVEARKREVQTALNEPLVAGVDIARFGDDQSVIAFRKGRDARTIPWQKFRGVAGVFDSADLAAAIAEAVRHYGVDALMIDGGGVGGPVIDFLRRMNLPCSLFEVAFGGRADRVQLDLDATRYANKRSEIWGNMKTALPGLAIPDDDDLQTDLTGIYYGFRETQKGTETQLEEKKHMKDRGLSSPDMADALACTFAYPVMPSKTRSAGGPHVALKRQGGADPNDYDPLAAA